MVFTLNNAQEDEHLEDEFDLDVQFRSLRVTDPIAASYSISNTGACQCTATQPGACGGGVGSSRLCGVCAE